MEVDKDMKRTEQSRKLIETLQLEIAAAESVKRETDIAMHSIEIEVATVEMGRRGAETAGSQLSKRKFELETNYKQLKATLETIKTEVETLERLATNRRKEEATLTTRLTKLREKTAVVREQET